MREVGASEVEVVKDSVLARIGTPVDERLRDSWQVKLSRGTRLQVLERKTSGQGQLTNVWYKIPPPPGEVRYVKGQFVRPADGRRPIARPDAGETGSTNATVAKKPRPAEGDDAEEATTKRRPTRQADEGDEWLPRDVRDERPAPTRQFDDSPRGRLDHAQTAYREMMKKNLIDRDIESVRSLFERAAKATQTEADHVVIAQRLEDLEFQAERQAKLAELERLLRKSKQRDESLLSMGKRKPDPDADATVDTEPASPPQPPLARFDASGVLRKSSVTIDGKPAFILSGPYGGIRCYVTGAPGVDLRKYLDQLVAVRGPANYRDEVRNQHILVRDVTPVEVKR